MEFTAEGARRIVITSEIADIVKIRVIGTLTGDALLIGKDEVERLRDALTAFLGTMSK